MTRLRLLSATALLSLGLLACPGGEGTVDPDGGLSDAGRIDAGADAGSDGGGPSDAGSGDGGVDAGEPPCARAKAVRTAPLDLLDVLRVQLALTSDPTARAEHVATFWSQVEAQGGTPLVSAPGAAQPKVAFVVRAEGPNAWSVAGAFNDFTPGAERLAQVAGSEVLALELELSEERVWAYKLVEHTPSGPVFREDLRAHHVEWDGLDRGGVGEFNALAHPDRQSMERGRLQALRGIRSELLPGARDVFVYVPAAYEQEGCPHLPVLYVQDGNESLTRAPFTKSVDPHLHTRPQDAAILVFVALPSQDVRLDEYTFGPPTQVELGPGNLIDVNPRGDTYLRMLTDELVPRIDGSLRTCAQAENRGLAGASLGGLISTYGGFEHADHFGFVGSQSGSFFWNDASLVKRAAAEPVVPLRFWIDYGCPDDNCEVNRDLIAALEGRGYPLRIQEEAGGQHDWSYWQRRFPQLLTTFVSGAPGCRP